MFACISGNGIGLHQPADTPTELQFTRSHVAPYQPGGLASTKEWLQVNHTEGIDYEKDPQRFHAALDFVKATKSR